MIIKDNDKYSDLEAVFNIHLNWHKARVKFLVSFICALCKLQTVCFTKLAQGFEGEIYIESKLRKIQRFFADFAIDENIIARLIFALLPEKPPYRLSLDRTNWKFGQTNINILMLSITYKGVGIPIMWTMLNKRGNSNCQERILLMKRYLNLFGKESIESLLADREFIGQEWFCELVGDTIPFYIRIRNNMWIDVPGKGRKKVFWLFNHLQLNQSISYRKIVSIDNQLVYLTGAKVLSRDHKTEFLIIASYKPNQDALILYKDRWQIETMFRAFKSSGFNLEDTHLTDITRISKLLSLIAIAFVWAYLAGIDKHLNIKSIKIKKHGRRAYSFFKYGLIHLANILLSADHTKIKDACKLLSCT